MTLTGIIDFILFKVSYKRPFRRTVNNLKEFVHNTVLNNNHLSILTFTLLFINSRNYHLFPAFTMAKLATQCMQQYGIRAIKGRQQNTYSVASLLVSLMPNLIML